MFQIFTNSPHIVMPTLVEQKPFVSAVIPSENSELTQTSVCAWRQQPSSEQTSLEIQNSLYT